jgi:hypothetical protein
MARTTLLGTRFRRNSSPVRGALVGARAVAVARVRRRARASGERPSPGRITFTSATPRSTAMKEAATV